jgi:restriction system protein
MTEVWGIHMPTEVGNGPLERGLVSLGWPDMGDIFALPNSRETFKERLAQTRQRHPDAS